MPWAQTSPLCPTLAHPLKPASHRGSRQTGTLYLPKIDPNQTPFPRECKVCLLSYYRNGRHTCQCCPFPPWLKQMVTPFSYIPDFMLRAPMSPLCPTLAHPLKPASYRSPRQTGTLYLPKIESNQTPIVLVCFFIPDLNWGTHTISLINDVTIPSSLLYSNLLLNLLRG